MSKSDFEKSRLPLRNKYSTYRYMYYTGSDQLYLPCLYFGPLFLSRHRLVGTVCHCCGYGHEPEAKKKKKIKKNIPSALFTCTLKSKEKVII